MGHLSTLCQGCCSKDQAYPLHINAERGLQCLPQWKTLQECVGTEMGNSRPVGLGPKMHNMVGWGQIFCP